MTDTNQVENQRRYIWLLCFALVALLIASCLSVWFRHHQQIALLDRIEAAGGISCPAKIEVKNGIDHVLR
ncbi:MAG: hypothetical protein P8M30_03185 [Planctomycetaceae bacterium]|nr:hypothetical protein [Planctomycetaceae bacterium]MDG2388304.1 hypothetical protein [Planctomycetaceae bacterium]